MRQSLAARLHAARQKESGFTLIELLITIVILGVLAGIVVFAVASFKDNGVEAACKADKKQVQIAAEAYFAAHNAYPTAMTDLVPTYLKSPVGGSKYTVTLHSSGSPAVFDGSVDVASVGGANIGACAAA